MTKVNTKYRLIKDNQIVGYERWFSGNKYFKPGWEYKKETWQTRWEHIGDNGFISHTDKDEYIGMQDKKDNELYENDIIKLFHCDDCRGLKAKIKRYWDGWWYFTEEETKGRMSELIPNQSAINADEEYHYNRAKCIKIGNIYEYINWRG